MIGRDPNYPNTNLPPQFRRIKKVYKCHNCKKELNNAWPYSRGNPTNEIQYLCLECKNELSITEALNKLYLGSYNENKNRRRNSIHNDSETSIPTPVETVRYKDSQQQQSTTNKKGRKKTVK